MNTSARGKWCLVPCFKTVCGVRDRGELSSVFLQSVSRCGATTVILLCSSHSISVIIYLWLFPPILAWIVRKCVLARTVVYLSLRIVTMMYMLRWRSFSPFFPAVSDLATQKFGNLSALAQTIYTVVCVHAENLLLEYWCCSPRHQIAVCTFPNTRKVNPP